MIRIQITATGGRLELDKRKLKSVMRSAGAEIRARTRAMLSNSSGAGRVYKGLSGTPWRPKLYLKNGYRASAPGQPPVKVDGELEKSIVVRVFKSGEGVAIRNVKFYSLFLEAGAKGGAGNRKGGKGKRNKRGGLSSSRVLLPRPALSVALEQAEASLSDRIGAAINDGLTFKRAKLVRTAPKKG